MKGFYLFRKESAIKDKQTQQENKFAVHSILDLNGNGNERAAVKEVWVRLNGDDDQNMSSLKMFQKIIFDYVPIMREGKQQVRVRNVVADKS